MKNFDSRVYSISDFIEWNDSGLLELSPDFQRRDVWSEKAKSYLIDTVIRGKPIPKIIITQRLDGSRNVRVVVDGQQRLRAIIDFYLGNFKINKAHNTEYASMYYDDLPDNIQREIKKYELGVDLLFDTPYEEILDIFARLNSYTVRLVDQELFNAKYLGFYKKYAYDYGYKYVKYFIDSHILSKLKVTRMAEAELSSDLFMLLLDEIQSNKNVENFYIKYEDNEDGLSMAGVKFDNVMSFIGELYPSDKIIHTNWNRIHLFYSLFAAIAHMLYGVKNLDQSYRIDISEKTIGKLRVCLDTISFDFNELSDKFDDLSSQDDGNSVLSDNSIGTAEMLKFIYYSRRGTTDTAARIYRANYISKRIYNFINN